MIDGVSVDCGDVEIFYQEPDEGMDVAEPAIVIRRYAELGPIFGIVQGDQEITIGGARTMKRLGKCLLAWAKAEAVR